MRPTVYIETTIPSYYADSRADLMRDIERTRQWWDVERCAYECFLSPVVLQELERGDYHSRAACLELVEGLPLLELNDEVSEIAEVYESHKVMPRFPVRDSLHVAIASYYRMEYLLTWNCRHLANANKIRHLEALNAKLHLHVPIIATPHMLVPLEDS